MAAKIRIELEVGADGAVKGISATSGALKGLSGESKSAGTSFASLTGSFITAQAVIGGVKAGFEFLKNRITETIGAAASFESAFTGVEKTLSTTGLSANEAEVLFRSLRGEFEEMSRQIPITFEELAGIGEAAGQLGVGAAQITDFTETIAKLGVTTNLTTEQAATQLARLATVTGGIQSTNFEALGSSLVALGNNFATTEAEILGFAQRIAATGDIVGLAQTDILALGAAFTSAGVPIEAGGTAVQKTLITISDAIAKGGSDLQAFASVAGQSAQEFAAAFREDAGGALVEFLAGLSQQGDAAFGTLENLGLGSERTKTALLSAAQSSDQLAAALKLSSEAFAENNALQREAELRFGTFDSQVTLLSNTYEALIATVGSFITENQALGAVMASIREALANLTVFIKENRVELIELVSKGILYVLQGIDLFLIGLDLLVGGFATLVDAIDPVIDAIVDFAKLTLEALPDNFLTASTRSALENVVSLGEGIQAAGDFAQTASEGINRFDQGVLDTIDSVSEATRRQLEYEEELGETALRLPDVAAGSDEAADAVGNLGAASGEASEELKKLVESLGKLGDAQLRQDVANLDTAINQLGGASALNAAQLDAAAKSIETFEKAGVTLSGTLQDVKARIDELETVRAVEKLTGQVEELGAAAQQKQLDVLVKAVEQLGDTSDLSDKQVELLAKEIDALGLEAQDVPPELRAIQEEMKALAREANVKELTEDFRRLSGEISMEGRAALEDIEDALRQTTDAGFELSREAMDEIISQLDQLAASDPGLKDDIEDLRDEFDITSSAAVDFGQVMEDLSNVFNVFGIDANSALGGILASFGQLSAAIPQLKADLKEGRLVGGAIGQGDIGGAISGIAGGIGAVAGATSRGGAGASALKGGAAGAAAGAQVAGPIGAAIGGIGGAIVGFFRGRGRDKLRKQIQDTVGAAVSEDLAEAIKKGAKDAGRTIEQQSLLNLGDIIGEAGVSGFEGGLKGVQDSAIKLLQGIADGTLPAKEGISELGEAFGLMAEEAFTAGQVADAELINVVKAARAAGQDIPEISAFVADQLSLAAEGVGKLVGGIQIFDVEDAQAQATIFASSFWATVEEVGLLEAVDSFGPAFEELRAKISEQFGEGAVDLGGVGRIFEIASDENFRPLLEGVEGLDQALQGLANSGYLTTESFQAFEQQAGTAFEQLTASGLTAEEALQQMGPLLNNLVQASNEFGIPLDENTQKLVEQAEAAGVAFRVEPMQQVADTLVIIAELLGATDEQLASLGNTATTTGEQTNAAFNTEQIEGWKGGLASARDEVQGIGDEISGLPDIANESVAGTAAAFEEGAGRITEGLGPISDKLESEIRQVGTETAKAIDESFTATNVAIESGLSDVASTFTGQVVPAALQAANATASIADAAKAAAAAARDIDFPDVPGGDGGNPDRSSASGYSGLLGRDMTFQAHQGELVNIISADNVRKMRAGADVSAQNGFGGMTIDIGGVTIPISIQGEQGGGAGRFSEDFEERVLAIVDRAIREDIGGIVEDAMRPALQEQT